MEIKREFFVVLLIGLSTSILSYDCSSKEDIPHCECRKESEDTLETKCEGHLTEYAIEDYRKILQNSFSGKRNIELTFRSFTKESRLPSKMFDGFHITRLEIEYCNVSKWADEEGGPAFVGLEDSLEKLEIRKSMLRPRTHRRYEDETAPMTFGHLRKLREVDFSLNRVYNFGNEWFGKGANSLEILNLELNYIYDIGDQAFASLTNLKEIKLDQNQILIVTRSMFPNPAEYLEEIKMMGNKLRALPDDMFTNMPSLSRIDLSSNAITRLAERTWRPVWTNLEYLMFDHNYLFCNDHINWIFKVRPPQHLTGRCFSPVEMKRKSLMELIEERKKGVKNDRINRDPSTTIRVS